MTTEQTIACPICRRPYKFYALSAADQSACPDCVTEAERLRTKPSDHELEGYARRRAAHFGQRR